jgi:hypothetical protein
MAPLTAIALIAAIALYLTRPGRHLKPKQEETTLVAPMAGWRPRLPTLESAAVAASSLPMLLALALAWLTNISTAVTNLFIGVALAYHIFILGSTFWYRLRSNIAPVADKKDSVVLVCPFSRVDTSNQPAAVTGEAGQANQQQGFPPEAPIIQPSQISPGSAQAQPNLGQPAPRSVAENTPPVPGLSKPLTAVRIHTPSDEEVIEKDQTISVQVITPRDLEPPRRGN